MGYSVRVMEAAMKVIILVFTVSALQLLADAKSQCSNDSHCHRGVKQCVKRKGGLSCLWGKCKTYNVCAECNKDSDCKRFLGLDVSLTPTTQQTRYCFNIISIFARTVSGTCATSATTF